MVQKAGSQRFLVEHPQHSLRMGRHRRVPVMGGVTKHEGSFFLGSKYQPTAVPVIRFEEQNNQQNQTSDPKK